MLSTKVDSDKNVTEIIWKNPLIDLSHWKNKQIKLHDKYSHFYCNFSYSQIIKSNKLLKKHFVANQVL